GDQPDDDQCFERELAEAAVIARRSTPGGIVVHFEIIERSAFGEVAKKSSPLLLQGRDGTVDVVGLHVQTELRYPGDHLSTLVANDDVKFIDTAHRDLVPWL